MRNLAELNRWQAAGIHLGISAAVGALALAAMLLVWYPGAFFAAAGGAGLILILLGVDVSLGPLLTLVVFDPRKRRLRSDLAVIAALQLAALVYGASVMFAARPVFLVFAVDRFEMISAAQIDAADLARGAPPFNKLPLTGPQVIGVRRPSDPEEAKRILFLELDGRSLAEYPEHYVPYAQIAAQAGAKGRPLDDLRRKDPSASGAIDAAVRAAGRTAGDLRFLPVQSRDTELAAIVTTGGELVGLVPAKSW